MWRSGRDGTAARVVEAKVRLQDGNDELRAFQDDYHRRMRCGYSSEGADGALGLTQSVRGITCSLSSALAGCCARTGVRNAAPEGVRWNGKGVQRRDVGCDTLYTAQIDGLCTYIQTYARSTPLNSFALLNRRIPYSCLFADSLALKSPLYGSDLSRALFREPAFTLPASMYTYT